ncbi:MAG: EAL domain-containing response regulator [Xanthomonadaceae bacterium]|nr:EAL domain-containing response regulator [Xanthomonadaceae bacterium]
MNTTKTVENNNKKRLLIVDDDEMVGRTLQSIARRKGFEARFTCDAERFLELVEQWKPGVLAIDLVMPGMDGVEVLRRLGEKRASACVIVTSGVGHRVLDAAVRSAREHGLHIAGMLPKPFSIGDVARLLGQCDVSSSDGPAPRKQASRTCPVVDEALLLEALDRDQFHVEYQPKVRCADGSLAGFEALARWQHPELGLIPPDHFIQVAERTELMPRLTRHLFEIAIEWFSGLQAPKAGDTPLTLAVNLSARSLEREDLVGHIRRRCQRFGLQPNQLIFELTETSAMSDAVRSLDLLTSLRVAGFQLSIDDFGTGYSSMVQLVRLPFSEIKVDKSFVMSAEFSEESRTVVRSVIELGKALGLETTAEGVETEWAMDFLCAMDCDYAQGFLIARPLDGQAVQRRWNL